MVTRGTNLLSRDSFITAPEYLAQHASTHLFWRVDAIDMQDRGGDVIDRSFEAHQAHAMRDPRPHGKERARHVIAIGEVVLGYDRRRLFMVHVGMRIGFLKLAQRLDAVI